jgi:hypothetical protein
VGGELGIAARWDWFSGRLGVSALAPQSTEFEGGTARGWLGATHTSLCAHWAPNGDVDLAGCGFFLAAFASVDGTGYERSTRSTRPLFALGPEARLSGRIAGNWGWLADGAPLLLLLRQRFVVTGAGEAFSVPRVAGWLGMGLWRKIE